MITKMDSIYDKTMDTYSSVREKYGELEALRIIVGNLSANFGEKWTVQCNRDDNSQDSQYIILGKNGECNTPFGKDWKKFDTIAGFISFSKHCIALNHLYEASQSRR